jgi:hypothetical protein
LVKLERPAAIHTSKLTGTAGFKLLRLAGGRLLLCALGLNGCGDFAATKLLPAKTMMTGTISVACGH